MNNEKEIPFLKIHGCKNSFVVVHGSSLGYPPSSVARRLCSQSEGLGTDGVMVVGDRTEGAAREVEMFNPDGSAMGMCGNGIRCVTRFIHEVEDDAPESISFSVYERLVQCETQDEGRLVRVDMGPPSFNADDIPFLGSDVMNASFVVSGREFKGSLVSMGNPHLVIRLKDQEFETIELERWGALLEHHPLFPKRTNVHFVRIIDRSRCEVKVWERGAGVTMACGTGACAVAVTGIREGTLEGRVEVLLPGGALTIEWEGGSSNVFMTGPTQVICRGVLYL